jgi:1-phosphofructokinase
MILTVTMNPAVDHTVKVDGELNREEVMRTSIAQYDAGGKGINVSKYLTELDSDTLATGLTGGFLGQYVRDQLTRTKIPNDFVEMGGCTRLNTTILDDDGEYKLNQPGHRVKAETVREMVETIRSHDPDTVVIAGSLPPGLGPATIDKLAHAGDWDAVVDVQGSVLKQLRVDYALCKPNEVELGEATDMPVDTVEDCLAAAEELQGDRYERVLASLGADGAVMVTPDNAFHAAAPDVDKVVDTVGAGDALLAGVLDALTHGERDGAAIRFGVAVAAPVIAVPGTTVPTFSEIRSDAETIAVTPW